MRSPSSAIRMRSIPAPRWAELSRLPSDEQMIELAATVAETSRRLARPNPWVGAVVRSADGRIATGATGRPGHDHAEIVALKKLGRDAAGATMWVTLEPCSHWGKTPPCAERIVEAGVSRVVVSLTDPDPRVNGTGIAMLREAGIEVEVGVGAQRRVQELRPYLVSRSLGRPYVLLKMAMTADGYTAAADGSSKWITGEAARLRVQELRADSDAILVGAGTIRADDPRLDLRPDGAERSADSPLRVVLGEIPAQAKVNPALAWSGTIDALLDTLSGEGVIQLMVEGGASVAHSFLSGGLVDEFRLFIAPKLLGGSDGRRLFEGAGAKNMSRALGMRTLEFRSWEGDLEVALLSERAQALLEDFEAGPAQRPS